MLKTPKMPIWLTKVNHMYGLLFSTNLDLVSDWRIENRFSLLYYTGLVSQTRTATLSIGQLFCILLLCRKPTFMYRSVS